MKDLKIKHACDHSIHDPAFTNKLSSASTLVSDI